MSLGTAESMNPSDFGRVAVLLGGASAEREVSLNSGAAVIAALQSVGVDAFGFDPAERDLRQLLDESVDQAFIALHGRGGEDGVIQGALEQLGVAYTGSGVLGSALGMDKLRCKQLWRGLDLPTPAFYELSCDDDAKRAAQLMDAAVIVKPAHEGSSIGMARADNGEQLLAAWHEASQYDGCVLAETWVTGAEYTVAILGGRALPMIRLETPNVFYDYQAKYLADNTRYLCPCGLPAKTEQALQDLALRAFSSVGASVWGRVDLMVDEQDRAWLLEVNTSPGMTDHSLVPMAAKQAGLDFAQLCCSILSLSRAVTGRPLSQGAGS